jgi:restriction system protein
MGGIVFFITRVIRKMPIPDYQSLMLPLLKLAQEQGPLEMRKAVRLLSDLYGLTESERRMLLPSGTSAIIANRVGWARTYLKKAGLLDSPVRGQIVVTKRGEEILSKNVDFIDVKFLKQFDEFRTFQTAHKSIGDSNPSLLHQNNAEHETPEELLEQAHLDLKEQVLSEILERVRSCSPEFFEALVVEVVVKMGYGGSRKDAGKAIGRSGDEGVDGIINEDRLGLDLIYLQAKRWGANVGRPEIQKFAGALQGKRAKKGIFITTSDFTNEAIEFVRNIDSKIVLVNGKSLVDLMWECNVGVSLSGVYEVKRVDIDYFSE